MMNFFKSTLIVFLLCPVMPIACFAQDTAKAVPQNHPRILPVNHHRPGNPLPVLPQFPGGKDSLSSFIKKNTHYPKEACKHHVTGIIEVDFTVTTTGSIKDPVVKNHLGYGCDEEAIRVVNLMPKWISARKGRDLMELTYHVDIPFGNQESPINKP
jgi:hypothetical protein